MSIALYVAVARNGVIGRDKGIPWRLSTDLKRFKAGTMGKPVVMGRKTFESIGKPLPGRRNIVVTRDTSFRAEGVEAVTSLGRAFSLAGASGAGEVCVIGGGQIYEEAMPDAERLCVTHVEADVEGDTYFPRIDPSKWAAVSEDDIPAGPSDTFPTRYVVYERRSV